MRLGQLARKLALRPVEIVGFLAARDIQIENGSNTKLAEAHVDLILEQFAPNGADLSRLEEEMDVPESATAENATVSEVSNTPGDAAGENKVNDEKTVELIRAPKVELSGLKVVGKIDLPEPKKKVPFNESTPQEEPPKSASESTKRAVSSTLTKSWKSTKSFKSGINPVVLQRERQAREAEEQKRERNEREKEQRTLHYLKKMNAIRPTKAMKIVHDEPVEEMPKVAVIPPKTLWGRFMKWLNT